MPAGKNQVTLTFAGATEKLERSFERVGAAGQNMTKQTARMGAGFAKFGRAMEKDVGVRVDRVGGGLDLLSQFIGGPLGSALTAGAFAFSTLSTALGIVSIANLKAAASWVVHKTAMVAGAAATKAAAAAQWLLNIALSANPIGLVILALVALGAILVVAWTKSERFRTIVVGAFNAVVGWARRNWPLLLGILTGPIGLAVVAFIKHKDKILGVFRAVADGIKGAFSTAFQAIRDAWNSTLGGKGFSFGGWDPPGPGHVPGFSLHIPRLHSGGTVPGAPGSDQLAVLQAGEHVTPAGGGRMVIELRSSGTALDDALVHLLSKAIRRRGGGGPGSVQLVLGRG